MSNRNRTKAVIDRSVFTAPDRSLTLQMIEFCHEYVSNGGNGTQAALAAGYSETSAAGQASRLLRNPLIQQELMKETLQHIGLAAAPALMQIKRLVHTAKSDYVRLEAAKDLLDRAGFRPPDRLAVQLDASLSVSFDVMPKGG